MTYEQQQRNIDKAIELLRPVADSALGRWAEDVTRIVDELCQYSDNGLTVAQRQYRRESQGRTS